MIGKIRLTGFVAWLMWLAVHLVYITGFKNRVTKLLHWFVSLHRPRPVRAHRDRAADLRPRGAEPARGRRVRPGQPTRRVRRDAGDDRGDSAARSLEARAAEEARLTDSGERGMKREDVSVGGGR